MPIVQPHHNLGIPEGHQSIKVRVLNEAGVGGFRVTFENGGSQQTSLSPAQVKTVHLFGATAEFNNIDDTALKVDFM